MKTTIGSGQLRSSTAVCFQVGCATELQPAVNPLNDEMLQLALPGSPEKKQEARDAQKVLRLLAKKLRPLGFERTKPTFFVRPGKVLLEFVHVHKYTFGPRFRLHLGVRVRFDRFAAQALNGPAFDGAPGANEPGAQGRFNYRSDVEAIEACAEAMAQTVETVGNEWFDAMIAPEELLAIYRSPTTPISIDTMEIALADPGAVVASDETRRAFNVG